MFYCLAVVFFLGDTYNRTESVCLRSQWEYCHRVFNSQCLFTYGVLPQLGRSLYTAVVSVSSSIWLNSVILSV